jgi:hypothetical protein
MKHNLTKQKKAEILIAMLRRVRDGDDSVLDAEAHKQGDYVKFNVKLILRRYINSVNGHLD